MVLICTHSDAKECHWHVNFVKKITYFGIRHFIESPSLTSCNTGKVVPPWGGGEWLYRDEDKPCDGLGGLGAYGLGGLGA